jgi:hypothetical protein
MGLLAASRDATRSTYLAGALAVLGLSACALLVWWDLVPLVGYAYPGTALLIALWLYGARTPLYLGFTWWIWFVTPFVRRIVDYNLGHFTPVSPVMLAPYLVTAVALLTALPSARRLLHRRHVPFLLVVGGIAYGYLVGLIKVGALSATFALLQWIVPVALALHIALLPSLFSAHRRVILSTFVWGLLVMGTYGVAQYIHVLPWDAQWLLESGMWVTMGRPGEGSVRIFSTLNSTGPFAYVAVAGLLLLFVRGGRLSSLAAVPGSFCLLFSLVRSAWGGWLVGMAVLAWQLTGALKARLVKVLVVTVVLSVPLFVFAPNTDRAVQRAETLMNLEGDTSFRARVGVYERGARELVSTPLGVGLGNYGTAAKLDRGDVVSFDSGVLAVALTLGWLGTLLYGTGLGWLLVRVVASRPSRPPPLSAFVSIVVSFLFLLLFVNVMVGVLGMTVWTFLGLSLAAVQSPPSS